MFCSNCGNELREGLKYCNRCGVRLETGALEKIQAALPVEQNKLAQTLSMAVGWVGFTGLIALAIMIGNLIRKDDIHPAALILVIIFSALVFGIVFMMLRQISLLSGHKTAIRNNKEPAKSKPELLEKRAENAASLPSFREPVNSVTEHTTRTFNEAFVEKNKP